MLNMEFFFVYVDQHVQPPLLQLHLLICLIKFLFYYRALIGRYDIKEVAMF